MQSIILSDFFAQPFSIGRTPQTLKREPGFGAFLLLFALRRLPCVLEQCEQETSRRLRQTLSSAGTYMYSEQTQGQLQIHATAPTGAHLDGVAGNARAARRGRVVLRNAARCSLNVDDLGFSPHALKHRLTEQLSLVCRSLRQNERQQLNSGTTFPPGCCRKRDNNRLQAISGPIPA